jgi:SRSO17 transposase
MVTTLAEATGAAWAREVKAIHGRVRARLSRAEPRRRLRAYLEGLVSSVERKNSWQLAEQAGEPTPTGMQRLLAGATWDAEAVRDELQAYVVEQLGDPEAVLILDETGFPKQGSHSVGVARQYSGTTGRRENQQIGVFLAYAGRQGCALIDRALYLPETWAADRERRAAAGVPETVAFATKSELAQAMLAHAFAAELPTAWVVADTVYGGEELRRWLAEQDRRYVLAVPCTHAIWSAGEPIEAQTLAADLPETAWMRLSAGEGSQGPRWYDWACLALPYAAHSEWAHWLLARRSVRDPSERAYYRVYAPADTSPLEMVGVAGRRWCIETAFEEAKGLVGLDHYEVRRWEGWHRHITLVLLAYAALVVTRATVAAAATEKGGLPSSSR